MQPQPASAFTCKDAVSLLPTKWSLRDESFTLPGSVRDNGPDVQIGFLRAFIDRALGLLTVLSNAVTKALARPAPRSKADIRVELVVYRFGKPFKAQRAGCNPEDKGDPLPSRGQPTDERKRT
jgi:hypothetical protein